MKLQKFFDKTTEKHDRPKKWYEFQDIFVLSWVYGSKTLFQVKSDNLQYDTLGHWVGLIMVQVLF